MYYVYVLYSADYNKIYIGYTSNLSDRIMAHNEKATKGYTVKFRPWIIAFHEEFTTKASAMRREKQLKSSRGRNYICKKREVLDRY